MEGVGGLWSKCLLLCVLGESLSISASVCSSIKSALSGLKEIVAVNVQ